MSLNQSPASWEPTHIRLIGSLRCRFLAFVIDGILFTAVGAGIGAAYFDKLSQLGLWGRLVGFCIALPYFAVLESRIGGGQTIGKRWLKLIVVDKSGNTISFRKAIARYVIFAIPSYLNQIALPLTRTPWFVSFIIFVIVFGVGGSTLYLLTFNRDTRQGLHDLAVGAYVINADDSGPVETRTISRINRATVGLIFALTITAWILGNVLEKKSPFLQMRQDSHEIEQLDGVQRARVWDILSHSGINGSAKKVLIISVTRTESPGNTEIFADEVAKVIIENDRNLQTYDELSIRILYGYDIGIASRWRRVEYEHTPSEWRNR